MKMKKRALFGFMIMAALAGTAGAGLIYSNSFNDAAGTVALNSVPEINTIASYLVASTAGLQTDGSGRLEATNKSSSENYRFRLNPTALNLNTGLSAVKATVVMRAPSTTEWVGLSFGSSNVNGVLNTNAHATWLQINHNSMMVRGGGGTDGSVMQYTRTHEPGSLITLEYTYRWDKTVDLSVNGTLIASGLAVSYTNATTGLTEDPQIIWAMITMRNQDTIANGGAYIDSLTIETIPQWLILGLLEGSAAGVAML
jgi:hypothetical protein